LRGEEGGSHNTKGHLIETKIIANLQPESTG
jgi:hypothetical protein